MRKGAFYKDIKDCLFVIWVLKTLGWSDWRIARLRMVLPAHKYTIKKLTARAYAYGSTLKRPIRGKGRERPDIFCAGSSVDLEYINARQNQGTCGGGRQKHAIHTV
jgi:hypothetical protein